MSFPRKCYNCKKDHCDKDCPARKQLLNMDASGILTLAKEHNKLHNQICKKFTAFSLKCKHRGMIKVDILPHPGRCFHNSAAPYTQGFTNCNAHSCPRLNLEML